MSHSLLDLEGSRWINIASGVPGHNHGLAVRIASTEDFPDQSMPPRHLDEIQLDS